MNSRSNELLEWHLATLRQNAQGSRASSLTPVSLIYRDHEIAKQLIAAEAAKEKTELIPSSVQLGEPSRAFSLLTILTLAMLAGAAAVVIATGKSLFLLFFLVTGTLFVSLDAKQRPNLSTLDPGLKAALERLEASGNDNRANLSELSANQVVFELLRKFAVMEQKEKLIFDYCSLLLCELNSEGIIVKLNESAESIWGYRREDLYGASLAELLSVESKKQLEQILDLPASSQTSRQDELRVRHKNGEFLDLLWHVEWSSKATAFFCRVEDISERRNAERLRDELTAMINHDLRSPISSFYHALYNMLDQQYGQLDYKLEEVVSLNLRNIRTVLSLLDNLTSAQKLESGDVKPQKVTFELEDCFLQVDELLRAWCEAANLSLIFEVTDLLVDADLEQCVRILTNLCSNAIKWSPTGGSILVKAKRNDHLVTVEVIDNGPGLSAEVQETLFQRWGKGSTVHGPLAPSAGLGLYIAKKFTDLQGGQIGVKSCPGEGAVFWFTLSAAAH